MFTSRSTNHARIKELYHVNSESKNDIILSREYELSQLYTICNWDRLGSVVLHLDGERYHGIDIL